MSELRLTVDHLRLDYTGPFDANALYRHITSFLKERGFDLWTHKEFEHDTKTGKHIEWLIKPWKQISDNLRYWVKVRILIYNYDKVDAVVDRKKVKIGSGKVNIYFDGYAEMDQLNRWEQNAFYANLRNFYHKYVIWKKLEALLWDKMHYNVFLRLHSVIKERLKMEADAYEHRYFHKVR